MPMCGFSRWVLSGGGLWLRAHLGDNLHTTLGLASACSVWNPEVCAQQVVSVQVERVLSREASAAGTARGQRSGTDHGTQRRRRNKRHRQQRVENVVRRTGEGRTGNTTKKKLLRVPAPHLDGMSSVALGGLTLSNFILGSGGGHRGSVGLVLITHCCNDN